MLLVELLLVHQAHQCEALVYFPEVEYDLVVLPAGMIQLDYAARLFIKLEGAGLLVHPVDAGDIDQDVDQLGAYLVVLHLNWVGVGSYVDLGDDVEEEGFLDLRGVNQVVNHACDEAHLGE